MMFRAPTNGAWSGGHARRIAAHETTRLREENEISALATQFSPTFSGETRVPGWSNFPSTSPEGGPKVASNITDLANLVWSRSARLMSEGPTRFGGNPRIVSNARQVKNSVVTTHDVQQKMQALPVLSAEQGTDGAATYVAADSGQLSKGATAPVVNFRGDAVTALEANTLCVAGALDTNAVNRFWAPADGAVFSGAITWNSANDKHPVSYSTVSDSLEKSGAIHIYDSVFSEQTTISNQTTIPNGDVVPTRANATKIIAASIAATGACVDELGQSSATWIDCGATALKNGSSTLNLAISKTIALIIMNGHLRLEQGAASQEVRVTGISGPILDTYTVAVTPNVKLQSAAATVKLSGWLTDADLKDGYLPLVDPVLPQWTSAPSPGMNSSPYSMATSKYVVDRMSLFDMETGQVEGMEVNVTAAPSAPGNWSDSITVETGTMIFDGVIQTALKEPVELKRYPKAGESPAFLVEGVHPTGWYAMYAFCSASNAITPRLSKVLDPWSDVEQEAALKDMVAAQWIGAVYYDEKRGFFPQMSNGDNVWYPLKSTEPTTQYITSVMWKGTKEEPAQILSSSAPTMAPMTPASLIGVSWLVDARGKFSSNTRIKSYKALGKKWIRIGANTLPTVERRSVPLPGISITYPLYTSVDDEHKYASSIFHQAGCDATLSRAMDSRTFHAAMPSTGTVSACLTTPLVVRSGKEEYVADPRGKAIVDVPAGYDIHWFEIALFGAQFVPVGKAISMIGSTAGRLAGRVSARVAAKAEAAVVESLVRSEVTVITREVEAAATTSRVVAAPPSLPRVYVKAAEGEVTAFENAIRERAAVAKKSPEWQYLRTAYNNPENFTQREFNTRDFMFDELGVFDERTALSEGDLTAVREIGELKDIHAPGYNLYKFRINSEGVVDSVVFNEDLRVRVAAKYVGLLEKGGQLTAEEINQTGRLKNALDYLQENAVYGKPRDGYIINPTGGEYGGYAISNVDIPPIVDNLGKYQQYLKLTRSGGDLVEDAAKRTEVLNGYLAWKEARNVPTTVSTKLAEDLRSWIGGYKTIDKYAMEGMENSQFGEIVFTKQLEESAIALNIEGSPVLRSSTVGRPLEWGAMSTDMQSEIVKTMWEIRFKMRRAGWGGAAFEDTFGNSVNNNGRFTYIPTDSCYRESDLIKVWDNPELAALEQKWPAATTELPSLSPAEQKLYKSQVLKIQADLAKQGVVWTESMIREFSTYRKFRIANDILGAQYPEAVQAVNILNTVSFEGPSLNVRSDFDRAFYMRQNREYLVAARTNQRLREAFSAGEIGTYGDVAEAPGGAYARRDAFYIDKDTPIAVIGDNESPLGTSQNIFSRRAEEAAQLTRASGYGELDPIQQRLLDAQLQTIDTYMATGIRNAPPSRAIPASLTTHFVDLARTSIWNPLAAAGRRWALKAALYSGAAIAGYGAAKYTWNYLTTPSSSASGEDKTGSGSRNLAATPNGYQAPSNKIYDGAVYSVVPNATLPSGYGRVSATVATTGYSLPRTAISFARPGRTDLQNRLGTLHAHIPPYALSNIRKGKLREGRSTHRH